MDSFVVIVANPPRADTIVRKLAPGQDTPFIELEIELLQAMDTLDVTFSGYNSLTGLQRGRQPCPPAPPRGR